MPRAETSQLLLLPPPQNGLPQNGLSIPQDGGGLPPQDQGLPPLDGGIPPLEQPTDGGLPLFRLGEEIFMIVVCMKCVKKTVYMYNQSSTSTSWHSNLV